jgi:hypothetical protein
MQKPFIVNRHLNERWRMESNQYMVDKLRNMKSKINTKCPESFDFYKNNFNRTKSRENKRKIKKINLFK